MPMNHARQVDVELPKSAAQILGRHFFSITAGGALFGGLVLTAFPPSLTPAARLTMLLAIGLLLLTSLLGGRRARDMEGARLSSTLCGVGLVALLTVGLCVFTLQIGLRGPALGFCGLIVFSIGAITGRRIAFVLGGVAAAEMVFLAWAETTGLLPGVTAATPLAMALLVQCAIVLGAAGAGSLIFGVLDQYMLASHEREQRFRGLLHIAADWYWELDREFRFTHTSETSDEVSGLARTDRMNRKPWEIPDLGLSPGQLDAHRADLEAHVAFKGLMVRRRGVGGKWRIFTVSGEPRFDTSAAFSGYWGVGRDVTDEVRAQRAVAASETRYRELFSRSPSPLFLHRKGIIFDANEAAARLFGFANAAAMNGFDITTLVQSQELRDRVAERIAWLDTKPLGEGLPVSDFPMRSIDGRALSVQSTAVRVDTVGGPANLAIFFDITAREAAEAALRRSEAMLSHLFATNPDCVTLTEMATGRYAMVNPAFCALTGFRTDEVVGRTSVELGLWHDLGTRDQLLAQLETHGSVTDFPAVFTTKSGTQLSMLLAVGHFEMDQRRYLVLNGRDVTETERTRQQHAAILQTASIGIACTRDRLFAQTNPHFERMFGWEPGAMLGKEGLVVWASEVEYREIGQLAGPVLSAGLPFEVERRMRRHDGSEFWCRLLAQAVDRSNPGHGGTIWIAEDVTERRRLDQALAAARDAAEAASRAKSSFLANTSHEIRTPLNGLLGLTRLAMQEGLPDQRRQQYLAQILDSAQSLAGIMSDILDVSKIEAGKIALEDTPFDLRETLRAVHHAYESLAEVKGLALRLTVDPLVPTTVRGDPVRVRQILSNFITNALKFTERGEVHIEASETAAGSIRLAVSDTGTGVAPETQSLLFMPFSQGDSSTTRRFGGTGLGLSICRELARLMGGTVGMSSTPGQGSTFWAELPLPRSAPAQAGVSTELSDIEQLRGVRVLMAEDNPVNMMIGVAMLEHWGVNVAQAFDGHAAIEAVHAAVRAGQPFDAVLMDVQMPVMGGHEAARELRRHYDQHALPIIALTAAALVSERNQALESGMDGFLTKPIDAPKLRQTLARQIGARRAARV